MKALAFAVFFDITYWVASRLSRARFKRVRVHHPAVIGPMDVHQSVNGSDVLFVQSLLEYRTLTASGPTCHLRLSDTVWMQLPLFAIGVAKEHETEIFEITTLSNGAAMF